MTKLFAALLASAFVLVQAPAFAQAAKKEEKAEAQKAEKKDTKAQAKKEEKKEEEKKAKPKKGGC